LCGAVQAGDFGYPVSERAGEHPPGRGKKNVIPTNFPKSGHARRSITLDFSLKCTMLQRNTETRFGCVVAGAFMTAGVESAGLLGDHRPLSPGVGRTGFIDISASRVLDIVGSATALLFFAPLLILVALAIAILDPGPIFFAHSRIGRGNRMFPCLKFRSMVVDSAARLERALASDPALRAQWNLDHKLKDDPRITRIGRFLRKSSLDELPQLLNVLRGDMSLVGPRPIVPAEVRHYGRYFREYCEVKPGITGLWQISGRSDTSYRRRVALDVTYVRTRSLVLNIAIIFKTIPAIILAKGSY
jgi:exopolysaccharide production protein ExoY